MVHFGQGDLSHHGVLRECATAHEMEEALAFARETGRPIWHQAFALSEPGEQDTSTDLTSDQLATRQDVHVFEPRTFT